MTWVNFLSFECPFRGLLPYEEDDAQYFFGREKWCSIIVDNLLASPLTLLYGPSGVGKSSLLMAGVASRMSKQAKVSLGRGESQVSLVVVCREWQDDPLATLRECIQTKFQELMLQSIDLAQYNDLCSLLTHCAQALTRKESDRAVPLGQVLLILDQFEEYFINHPHETGADTFAEQFPRAVNDPTLSLHVLISMREDSLAKLDRFKPQIPNLFANGLRIDHLDRDAATDAINKPIEEFNRHLPADSAKASVEDDLILDVLEQVKEEQLDSGGEDQPVTISSSAEKNQPIRVQTPFLQLVMTRLWEKECQTAYPPFLRRATLTDELKGAQNIVDDHLQQVMQGLSESSREMAVLIFDKLVTPGLSKIAYPLNELTNPNTIDPDEKPLDPEELSILLDQLSRGSQMILRRLPPAPGKQSEGDRYVIAHDVLAKPILKWRREQEHVQEQKRSENKRQVVKRLCALANFQCRSGQYQMAASLALQAFRFNNLGKLDMTDQVDDVVRFILNQPFISNCLSGNIGCPGSTDSCKSMSVAFPGDGNYLIAANGHQPATIKAWLWDLNQPSNNPKETFETPDDANSHIECMALSKDGRFLVCGGVRGNGSNKCFLRVWDRSQKPPVVHKLDGHTDMVGGVAFNPADHTQFASAGFDGVVILWDLKPLDEGKQVLPKKLVVPEPIFPWPIDVNLKDDRRWIWSVAFSPDGKMLASAGRDHRVVHLWNPDQPDQLLGRIELKNPEGDLCHKEEIIAIAFNPRNDLFLLAVGSRDSQVTLWDLKNIEEPHLLYTLKDHIECVRSVAFSSDGETLATAGEDQTIRIYNLKEPARPTLLNCLSGHHSAISSVGFHPHQKNRLATSSWDETVRIWDLGTPEPKVFKDTASVKSIAFSPDGTHLISAGWDPIIKVWDTELLDCSPREPEKPPTTPNAQVYAISCGFHLDQHIHKIIYSDHDGSFCTLDLKDLNKEPFFFEAHPKGVTSVAFDPNQITVASGCIDNNIRLWKFDQKNALSVFGAYDHHQSITSVCFSSNGNLLASASDDGVVGLWNVEDPSTPTKVACWNAEQQKVYSVAFSPKRLWLATGGEDKTVKIWDLSNPSKSPPDLDHVISAFFHNYDVTTVAFTSDGEYLVTGSGDGMVRVWNVNNLQKPPQILKSHTSRVNSITTVTSNNQTKLASCSDDHTICIWVLSSDNLADILRQKIWKNSSEEEELTAEEWEKFVGSDIPRDVFSFHSNLNK